MTKRAAARPRPDGLPPKLMKMTSRTAPSVCLTTKELRQGGRDHLRQGNYHVATSQKLFQNASLILTCSATSETLSV